MINVAGIGIGGMGQRNLMSIKTPDTMLEQWKKQEAEEQTKPESEILLLYETAQYPNQVPRNDYILRIKAYGGNKPLETFFRLYVNEEGYLRLKKYE